MSEVETVGSQLPGRFVVGKALAGEPVAAVFEALPASGEGRRGRAVVLHPMFEAALTTWFQRTGALLCKLVHPNLVEVYATGVTASGHPVWITEWMEGPTLRQRLREGPLSPEEAVRVLRSLAAALDHLHARTPPVLHRALTPDHVRLLDPDHRVKLLAVGDADRFDPPAAPPQYLSPEELDGDPQALTAAADVFSLATLAYELLKGEPAFGAGADDVIDAVRARAFPRLARSPRDPLGDIDPLLEKAWSLDPVERPATATALVQSIKASLDARRSMRGTPLEIVSGGRTQRVHMVEPEPRRGITSEMPPPVPAPAQHLRAPTLPGAPKPASVLRGATPVVRAPVAGASVRAPTPGTGVSVSATGQAAPAPTQGVSAPMRSPTPAMGVRAPTPAQGVRSGVPIGQAPLRAPTPAPVQSARAVEARPVHERTRESAAHERGVEAVLRPSLHPGFGAGEPTPYRGVPRVDVVGTNVRSVAKSLKATLDETPNARARRADLKVTLDEKPSVRARAAQVAAQESPRSGGGESFFPERDAASLAEHPDDQDPTQVARVKPPPGDADARALATRPDRSAADKPAADPAAKPAPWDGDHSFAKWKPPLVVPEEAPRTFRFTQTHFAMLLVALPLVVTLIVLVVGRLVK